MKTLNELFVRLISLNELDGNESFIYRFSDPDGVRSGKSGWSFGLCQFDTQNNDRALDCLKECGFTEAEIDGIVHQTVDVKPLAAKLVAHPDVLAKYDTAQLKHCLDRGLDACLSHGVPMDDTGVILACADYVNQYGSCGEGMMKWLDDLNRPFTSKDVLRWKLENTKYGRKHSADCQRRYDNLIKVLKEETV
jgi:hypothetical protein